MAEFDTQEVIAEDVEESMAITTQSTNAVASFADNLMADVTEQGYYSTFPVNTMEEKKILFAVRNDNELLRNHMDEAIEVSEFVIDTQVVNDSRFGARQLPCVHIISTDGIAYQSTSSGVVNSVCDILSSFGLPSTWEEPLKVVCRQTTTNAGNQYKYLTVE